MKKLQLMTLLQLFTVLTLLGLTSRSPIAQELRSGIPLTTIILLPKMTEIGPTPTVL